MQLLLKVLPVLFGFIFLAAIAPSASALCGDCKKVAKKVGAAAETAAGQVGGVVETAAEQAGNAIETAAGQIEDTVVTAAEQFGDEAGRIIENIGEAHQTAKRQFDTNLESVNEWLAKQEASFCRFMSGGSDEDCMEQGASGTVDSEGNVTVGNLSTGETFQVSGEDEEAKAHEATAAAAQAAEALFHFQIMDTKPSAANSAEWRQVSLNTGAEGIYAWGLALHNLPAEVALDPKLQELWAQLQSAHQAAQNVRNSGQARPVVFIGGRRSQEIPAGEVVKRIYDAYSRASDVWKVLMGTYRFSYLSVASDVLSPEAISRDSDAVMAVPGLYAEEKAAIDAGNSYFNALPLEIRLRYEAENPPRSEGPVLTNPR